MAFSGHINQRADDRVTGKSGECSEAAMSRTGIRLLRYQPSYPFFSLYDMEALGAVRHSYHCRRETYKVFRVAIIPDSRR